MNKVIIVGGDHHNGLNLARILGINGVEVHSVVVTDERSSFIAKSKYISFCQIRKSYKLAFDFIREQYIFEREKPVLIPYSDGAAWELDSRLDEFKENFFVPSINCKQGEVASLMNKENQFMFACAHNIKMAKSTVIYMEDIKSIPIDFPMPCILKPVISAEGDKRDISVCLDRKALNEATNKYAQKGYSRAFLQEFLTIDYEIDMFGCILHNPPYYCLIPTHTLRSWPPKGGTNSFSSIITNEGILNQCRHFVEELRAYGFYGLYDIELFVVGNDIYLNELNLRNSGDVYMGINQKYYYALAWYNDNLGIKNSLATSPAEGYLCMTECADIRHVIFEGYGLINWIRDYRKCSDYALKFKGDMHPALTKYLYYIKKMMLRHS